MTKLIDAFENMKNSARAMAKANGVTFENTVVNDGFQLNDYVVKDAEYTKEFYEGLKEQQLTPNAQHFKAITETMLDTYIRKNRDYGNSFDKSLDEDGLLVAKIRLMDKMLRFAQLIKNPAQVKEESLRDTLLDMGNYAIMTAMWLDTRGADGKFGKEPTVEVKRRDDYMDQLRYIADEPPGIVVGYNFKEDSDTADAQFTKPASVGADLDGDIVNGRYVNYFEEQNHQFNTTSAVNKDIVQMAKDLGYSVPMVKVDHKEGVFVSAPGADVDGNYIYVDGLEAPIGIVKNGKPKYFDIEISGDSESAEIWIDDKPAAKVTFKDDTPTVKEQYDNSKALGMEVKEDPNLPLGAMRLVNENSVKK